jgi:hypothetical protein
MITAASKGEAAPVVEFRNCRHSFGGSLFTVLTDSQITDYRAKVLLSALSLECKGMKRNGPSAYSIVKKEYNLKGNKQRVYDQLSAILAG